MSANPSKDPKLTDLVCHLRASIAFFRERSTRVREARRGIARAIGDGPVVEIGCGFGANSRYCRGPYLGLDMDEAALREARRRHPDGEFRAGSFDAATPEQGTTVLLSAVLHEIPDRERMLKLLCDHGHRRILVCDFDPRLRGWLRLWMRIFEPDANGYWGKDPVACLRDRGWSVTESRLTPALVVWDARAPLTPRR